VNAVLEPGATWRTRMPRGVLDPRCPHGEPVTTPADRRMLWHLEGLIAVAATSDMLRQAAIDLRAYLDETCEHHWHDYEGDDVIPAHRQCLWCDLAEPPGPDDGPARADALSRLAGLAPWPSPDRPVTADAVAAWLAVDAQRHLHRSRPDPGRVPDRAGLRTAAAELIAVHTLRALRRLLAQVADDTARYLVEALADGGAAAELVALHLDELGIDPGEVNHLDDATDHAGTAPANGTCGHPVCWITGRDGDRW
jgi:hypothetical protein